ncbi:VPLPA-CTERM-specific exosortase XrtD [Methylomonas paludis]|uniref:VPLPA-CTERM-specific exosortase XrtD n=1 Tax=Methylomonas paludis TaxID=1173101 RepID=A0A975MPV1_9GAMM|nr:VPLPA-CTERM-specific exosortase XrtD [Methylomonas paludis]QWF71772.1 VPLPA-CTERM-specific exosortase XrtD [Methylomonas paludis]
MTSLKQAHTPLNPYIIWLLWGIALVLLGLVFRVGIEEMVDVWFNVEEYSHGFFIPCISIYFLWLRRSEFHPVSGFKDSLAGLGLLLLGLLIFVPGSLAALYALEQYAFLIAFTGLFGVVFGVRGLRIAAIPLLFMVFMVPFPAFIISTISSKLQLISSWFGVEFIRACNIMVYLEGNVIDLGVYKLQVVDACSGLRYLFPLASLAFLCAYLFHGPLWQKWLIFLSSAPLTIFMNSFRIGVIGVLVNSWGTEMAEGFLHDFEGWAVFLLCMVLLFIEMWIFSRISGNKVPINELVQIPDNWSGAPAAPSGPIVLNRSFYAVLLLLLLAAGVSENFKGRGDDIIPQRKAYINFPNQVGNWQGKNDYLGQDYLDQLKLTDYVIMNYAQPQTRNGVNFYAAYYQSQRKGATIHSPRSCIPGGGWQISQIREVDFPALSLDGQTLKLNRAIIEKDETRQLVYFWFAQRGRDITNEYLAKWYLIYDAITMNRTDGSLIRIITNIDRIEGEEAAEQRLQVFLKDILPVLPPFVPGQNIVATH